MTPVAAPEPVNLRIREPAAAYVRGTPGSEAGSDEELEEAGA